MNNMSKAELNVALTPFMGGFTKRKLQDMPREDLVRMLKEAIERTSNKKKKRADGAPREAKGQMIVIDVLKSGWMTKQQILDKMIAEQPDRDPDKMSNYLTALLYRVLKAKGYEVSKRKSDAGTEYHIV
jgi:mannose-6-phosphate isomerase class I